MSTLHVRHVEKAVTDIYGSLIDLSDIQSRPKEEINDQLLSRALAAYSLQTLAQVEPIKAAASVVDGFDDNGVDAVLYDEAGRSLWLAQSKWLKSGVGGPELGDVNKFISGVKDLLNGSLERFNNRVRNNAASIEAALNDANTQIHVVLAYTGTQLSPHAERAIKDLTDELNDPSEIVEFRNYGLKDIHEAVSGKAQDDAITFEMALANWGQVTDPYKAFYGTVKCVELATLWDAYKQRLFHKNIRKFLGDTNVNDAIQNTIKLTPDSFFYFNNGVTILCKDVKKKPLGGADRSMGVFECSGAHIVNGAQTTGTLGKLLATNKDELGRSDLLVRLISLDKTPDGYATEITRATNTQNRVEKRDFVSLDPEQERLRQELYFEGVTYVFKGGDTVSQNEGCDFTEAAVALAMASRDFQIAATAKREVGRLWDDIKTVPYKKLFNGSLQGQHLWRVVTVHRQIQKWLKPRQARTNSSGDRNLAVHGNLFISFAVMSAIPDDVLKNKDQDITELVEKLTEIVLATLKTAQAAHFANAILGRLFYNLTKFKILADKVIPTAQGLCDALLPPRGT